LRPGHRLRSAPEPRRLRGAPRGGALDVPQSLLSRAAGLRRAPPIGFAGPEDVFAAIDFEANRAEGLLFDPGLQVTKEHSEIRGALSEPCGHQVDVPPFMQRNRPSRRKPAGEAHGRGEMAISKWTTSVRSRSVNSTTVRLGQPKDDCEIVSDSLKRRQLDSNRALRVEQDQRVFDRPERVLDSKTTDVGDRRGRGRPVADASTESDRLAGREVVAPSLRVRLHATTIAVFRRLSPDRFRSFRVGAASPSGCRQRAW
jgi:hypothetical protein